MRLRVVFRDPVPQPVWSTHLSPFVIPNVLHDGPWPRISFIREMLDGLLDAGMESTRIRDRGRWWE